MPDGARKSAIALKLFGLEGAKLIPFLNEGAKGIQAFEDEAARLGIVFSDDQIKAAEGLQHRAWRPEEDNGRRAAPDRPDLRASLTAGANAFKRDRSCATASPSSISSGMACSRRRSSSRISSPSFRARQRCHQQQMADRLARCDCRLRLRFRPCRHRCRDPGDGETARRPPIF
jgi:hypothetical protein